MTGEDIMLAKDIRPGMTILRKGDTPAKVIGVSWDSDRLVVTIQQELRFAPGTPVIVERGGVREYR